jgi:hypothetical protein
LSALGFAFVSAFFVLPKDANWRARFEAGVGAAAIALGVIWGAVLAFQAVRYRLRSDPVWSVAWHLSSREDASGIRTSTNGVSLICEGHPPVDVATLGHVEAVARLPNGEFRRMPQHGMGGSPTTLWFAPDGGTGPPTAGAYEVRWYGTTARRKQFEIARSKSTVRYDM